MGLDMYLEAEHYVGGGYEYMRKDPDNVEVQRFDAIIAALGTSTEEFRARYPEGNYLRVSVEVAYWRKANAVHAWFVKHVQGGKDECQRSYVERGKLTELRDVCIQILATVDRGEAVKETSEWSGETHETFPNLKLDTELAERLLPTQGGFFFGGTDYTEWYAANLESTVAQINAILDDPWLKSADLYYRASW